MLNQKLRLFLLMWHVRVKDISESEWTENTARKELEARCNRLITYTKHMASPQDCKGVTVDVT
jgi:hypothetical protein